jgi:hypothetical protein
MIEMPRVCIWRIPGQTCPSRRGRVCLSPSYFLRVHAALPRFPQRGQHFPGSRTPPPGGLGKVLGSLVPFERRASTCTDKTFRGPSRSPRSLLPREGLTKRFQHQFVPLQQDTATTRVPTTTWREQLLPLADCLLAGERGSKVRRQSLSGRRRPARRLRLLCRADQCGQGSAWTACKDEVFVGSGRTVSAQSGVLQTQFNQYNKPVTQESREGSE